MSEKTSLGQMIARLLLELTISISLVAAFFFNFAPLVFECAAENSWMIQGLCHSNPYFFSDLQERDLTGLCLSIAAVAGVIWVLLTVGLRTPGVAVAAIFVLGGVAMITQLPSINFNIYATGTTTASAGGTGEVATGEFTYQDGIKQAVTGAWGRKIYKMENHDVIDLEARDGWAAIRFTVDERDRFQVDAIAVNDDADPELYMFEVEAGISLDQAFAFVSQGYDDFKEVAYDDDSGEGVNAWFSSELEAGEYILLIADIYEDLERVEIQVTVGDGSLQAIVPGSNIATINSENRIASFTEQSFDGHRRAQHYLANVRFSRAYPCFSVSFSDVNTDDFDDLFVSVYDDKFEFLDDFVFYAKDELKGYFYNTAGKERVDGVYGLRVDGYIYLDDFPYVFHLALEDETTCNENNPAISPADDNADGSTETGGIVGQ